MFEEQVGNPKDLRVRNPKDLRVRTPKDLRVQPLLRRVHERLGRKNKYGNDEESV